MFSVCVCFILFSMFFVLVVIFFPLSLFGFCIFHEVFLVVVSLHFSCGLSFADVHL